MKRLCLCGQVLYGGPQRGFQGVLGGSSATKSESQNLPVQQSCTVHQIGVRSRSFYINSNRKEQRYCIYLFCQQENKLLFLSTWETCDYGFYNTGGENWAAASPKLLDVQFCGIPKILDTKKKTILKTLSGFWSNFLLKMCWGGDFSCNTCWKCLHILSKSIH